MPMKYETGIPYIPGRSGTPLTPWRAVRKFAKHPERNMVLFFGCHAGEAQAHEASPEASSETCTTDHGHKLAREHGPWRDVAEPMT